MNTTKQNIIVDYAKAMSRIQPKLPASHIALHPAWQLAFMKMLGMHLKHTGRK